jgi:hypothetical protein
MHYSVEGSGIEAGARPATSRSVPIYLAWIMHRKSPAGGEYELHPSPARGTGLMVMVNERVPAEW